MAEGQMCNPTLPSSDLVDAKYKEALTDKVDKLLKQCNIKKMKTIKEKSINRVVTETALRRNKGKGHNLDQTRKSPTKYKEKGLLTGTTGTLEENLIPGHDYYKTCHDEQYKLFNELSKRFPETVFLTNVEQRKDERGRWYLYRNDKKLDITQFLNVIDNITLEYIEQLSVIQEKKPDHDLQTIAESCKTIVMARYLNNMNPCTDLMKDNETKLWRNHVAVILSFAALLVILEMMLMKLKFPPEPKQNSQTIELTNEKPRKPEEHWFLTTVFAFILIGYFYQCLS